MHGRDEILLTGGAGFMGSAVARALGAAGWRVRVLDALTYAGRRTHLDGIELSFVHGDVCDAALVGELVPRAALVVHMAAETHVERSLADATPFVRTNVDGTRVVAAACAAAGKPLVHVSTDEVFGPAPEGVAFAEDAPHRPSNPYAATKSAAEAIVCAWERSFGLDARIVRCVNNYGPRQHDEKAIPGWISRALRGAPLPLHGQGLAVRDWLHVQDFADALVRIAAYRGPRRVFHLAAHQQRSNREVAAAVAELCGGAPLQSVPDRPGQDARYALDDAGTRVDLGWAPRVPFERGLAELVAVLRAERLGA
jgi:dTDP-glucose 4,6-dehydratase